MGIQVGVGIQAVGVDIQLVGVGIQLVGVGTQMGNLRIIISRTELCGYIS